MSKQQSIQLARILHTKIDWPTAREIGKISPRFLQEMMRLEDEWEKDKSNLTPSEGGTFGHVSQMSV